MAKKKSNINKYINDLGINEVYSKISRGSSFIPGVIDDAKLSSRVIKKDQSYKAKPFNKSLNNIRPILEAGFSSRGNFRTNYTIPLTQTYLLDTYSGAAAAYSVRKLSSSYSGSALRVRRSSDNAEQDIGFDGENLDTSALTTFVGANDGFVATWYDQSGNGNDATNSTASQQPLLVSSGSLNTINTKASLSFDTTDNLSMSSLSVTDQAIFTVFNNASEINTATGIKFILNGVNGLLTLGSSSGTIANERVYWATKVPKSVGENTTNIPTGQHVLSMLYNTSTFDTMFRDGVEYTLVDGSVGGFDATNFPTNYNTIGRSTSSLNDNLQELIIYQSDQSSNQSAIESNINAHYNIY